MANGTLKVSNIQTSSGSGTITIGQSGETVDMSNATQTGVGGVNTPSFHVTQSSSQSFANGTTVKITYDTEVYDVGSGFNTSNNNFTVPSGEAGKYFFYIQTQGIFCDSSTEFCNISLYVNDTQTKFTRHNKDAVATDSAFSHTSVVDLSAGDVIDARLYHSQGSTRSNDNDARVTYFLGYKLIG
tara:strand:- start:35 stop:589 length:555 start_codon:yes stop_codon:yes gene_type:complete